MAAKLVVPRSQEGAFLWQLFAGLDHVKDTAEFVDKLVAGAGVDATDRARIARELRERLPKAADQVAPKEVADVLEDLGVLAWVEDRRTVDASVLVVLRAALKAVLEDVPRGAMPRPVADALIAATRNVLGDVMPDASATAMLHADFVKKMEGDLWRRDAVMDRLVSSLTSTVMTVARLKAD